MTAAGGQGGGGAAGWLGRERVALAECDSTNDEAAARAAAGAPHGLVVTATAQRRGRGRLGRAWYSPPGGTLQSACEATAGVPGGGGLPSGGDVAGGAPGGDNLYLSCVLRPALPPAALPPITLAAGVAVAEAVAAFEVEARLKWPNDVLAARPGPAGAPGAAGRKLAGILTEMTTQAGRIDFVILGIGVNLATTAFPPELRDIATSLAIERGGRPVAAPAFLAQLLARLEAWLDRFFAGGIGAVAADFARWSGMAGRTVRVNTAAGPIVGRVRGITGDGGLDVVDDRGHAHVVMAGDVVEIEPGSGGGAP